MPKKQPGKKPAGAKKAGPSTLITFVLDRSGSMASIADAAISGFNEFKAERAGDPGETRMTLMMFEDDHEYICSAVPVAEVADLDHQTYRPGATTALYDAVGTAILEADAYLDAAAAKPDQVLFVILTDGLENASREFDQKRVFEMIRDRQKTREYDFLYLGANQDSYAESERMGVQSGRNPRMSPSITAVHTNTTPSAAEVWRPTAATAPPIAPEMDAASATRSHVESTSAPHTPSTPAVEPRSIAARARPPDRNATIRAVITKTPIVRTRILAANQRRRRGSQVKIVLIVPVCQEAATNEAPITSPRMLVSEEIPSRIWGSSASARCDGM